MAPHHRQECIDKQLHIGFQANGVSPMMIR